MSPVQDTRTEKASPRAPPCAPVYPEARLPSAAEYLAEPLGQCTSAAAYLCSISSEEAEDDAYKMQLPLLVPSRFHYFFGSAHLHYYFFWFDEPIEYLGLYIIFW